MIEEKPNSAVHKIHLECHVACHNLRRLLNEFLHFLIFTVKINIFCQGPKPRRADAAPPTTTTVMDEKMKKIVVYDQPGV